LRFSANSQQETHVEAAPGAHQDWHKERRASDAAYP
jgi:hypothetical protein